MAVQLIQAAYDALRVNDPIERRTFQITVPPLPKLPAGVKPIERHIPSKHAKARKGGS